MSAEVLEIYREHLNEQVGEDGAVSISAILDPLGDYEKEIFGIFDDSVVVQNKDSGNVFQKVNKPRLLIPELPYDQDLMTGMDVYIDYTEKTYSINFIQTDKEGVQVLWLVSS